MAPRKHKVICFSNVSGGKRYWINGWFFFDDHPSFYPYTTDEEIKDADEIGRRMAYNEDAKEIQSHVYVEESSTVLLTREDVKNIHAEEKENWEAKKEARRKMLLATNPKKRRGKVAEVQDPGVPVEEPIKSDPIAPALVKSDEPKVKPAKKTRKQNKLDSLL